MLLMHWRHCINKLLARSLVCKIYGYLNPAAILNVVFINRQPQTKADSTRQLSETA